MAGSADGTGRRTPAFRPLRLEDPDEIDGFRLVARLGNGGMGTVYLSHTADGTPAALKVVRRELAEASDFQYQFQREVGATRRVEGPFLVPVLQSDTEGPVPWLATTYVAGPSLGEAVRDHGPLAPRVVVRLMAGVAEALQAIHATGTVHRDLKPSNVLLAADGPRVIDFGVARAIDATTLAASGRRLGTPGFMAPEQVRGGELTAQADLFSLGLLACFAVTGEGAFGRGEPEALLYRIVHDEPDLQDCPDGLRDIIAACLAKAPDDRPGTDQVRSACQVLAGKEPARPTRGWLPPPLMADIAQRAAPEPRAPRQPGWMAGTPGAVAGPVGGVPGLAGGPGIETPGAETPAAPGLDAEASDGATEGPATPVAPTPPLSGLSGAGGVDDPDADAADSETLAEGSEPIARFGGTAGFAGLGGADGRVPYRGGFGPVIIRSVDPAVPDGDTTIGRDTGGSAVWAALARAEESPDSPPVAGAIADNTTSTADGAPGARGDSPMGDEEHQTQRTAPLAVGVPSDAAGAVDDAVAEGEADTSGEPRSEQPGDGAGVPGGVHNGAGAAGGEVDGASGLEGPKGLDGAGAACTADDRTSQAADEATVGPATVLLSKHRGAAGAASVVSTTASGAPPAGGAEATPHGQGGATADGQAGVTADGGTAADDRTEVADAPTVTAAEGPSGNSSDERRPGAFGAPVGAAADGGRWPPPTGLGEAPTPTAGAAGAVPSGATPEAADPPSDDPEADPPPRRGRRAMAAAVAVVAIVAVVVSGGWALGMVGHDDGEERQAADLATEHPAGLDLSPETPRVPDEDIEADQAEESLTSPDPTEAEDDPEEASEEAEDATESPSSPDQQPTPNPTPTPTPTSDPPAPAPDPQPQPTRTRTTTPAPPPGQPGRANCSHSQNRGVIWAEGMAGTTVRQIQCLLNHNYNHNLDVDGIFGPATASAVRSMQSCSGIAVDGEVGPDSWRYLDTPRRSCGN